MKGIQFGFIAILAWCLTSAGAKVFIGAIITDIPPTLLCFGIFFCAALFFLICNFKNLTSVCQKVASHFKTIILINITTFFCWYLTIYPLKFIEPAIVTAVILATVPIATLAYEILSNHGKKVGTYNIMTAILLFVGIFFLLLIVVDHKSAMKPFPFRVELLAFMGCISAGIALAINNIHTKQLSRQDFSPIDILTTRFFLIVLLTGILSHHNLPRVLDHSTWLTILIAALLLIIIPQTIFQYALRELEPITISITASLMPVFIFMLEFLNKALSPTFWTIMGVFYLTLVSMMGSSIQYKRLVLKK